MGDWYIGQGIGPATFLSDGSFIFFINHYKVVFDEDARLIVKVPADSK
jgi:hypothetical protein